MQFGFQRSLARRFRHRTRLAIVAFAASAWMSVTLAVANGGPDHSMTASTLVCHDRLLVYPKLVTNGTNESYTGIFSAFIVDSDNEPVSGTRYFTKLLAVFDSWDSQFTPFVNLSDGWSVYDAPTLEITYDQNTLVSQPIPGPFPASYPTVPFAGGSGTLTDPYLVSTAAQLQSIACQGESALLYYALTNDIDLTGVDFIPIGTYNARFRGGIDGRGHTITNLTIDQPGAFKVGFIGAAKEFYLRNLRFVNPSVRGQEEVGILLGKIDGSTMSVIQNVTIEGGAVRGLRKVGGLAGRAEEMTIVHTDADVDVVITTPRYHGPNASPSLACDEECFPPQRVGGLVGDAEEGFTLIGGTLDVRITQDPLLASIGVPITFGGIIGKPAVEVLVSGITAAVFIDLTLHGVGTSSEATGGLFGEEFDEGGAFVDSTATLDVTLRVAAGAGNNVSEFGGIIGNPAEVTFERLNVTGSLTIDTTNAPAGYGVRRIGGAFGEIGSDAVFLHDSHVAVDVNVLGGNADVEDIGGLVGKADWFAASDVRVGGRVQIDAGNVADVGGLIGDFANDTNNVQASLVSIIYLGDGVAITVPSSPVSVGPLWGRIPSGGYTGANIYWDSTRNFVETPVAGQLGLPATSAQLGDLTWLTSTASFDPDVWCVTVEDGVSVPAVIRVTPACQDGGGGVVEPTVPSAPSALVGTPGNARVVLQWNPPASDGGSVTDVIVIQQRRVGTSSWSSLHPYGRCEPDVLTCGVAANLTNGVAYDFRVAAENAVGRSAWSNVVRVTPGTTPAAPFLAASAGDASATLTWAGPEDDGGYPVTGFVAEMTIGVGGAWMPVTLVACGTPSATCGVASELTNGVTVGFRIAAVNALGMGAWSNVAAVMPLRNPGAPSNLAGVAGNGIATLTWTAPADTGGLPVAYQLEMNAGTGWMPASTSACTPATPTCAVVRDLVNGVPVEFRVAAITSAGVSAFAGPVAVTPVAPADVPVITRTIPGQSRGWLIIATPTDAIAGHEISLDDGATWQAVTPHVGDRVIRVTGLANGRAYPIRLRSVRADDTRSEAAATVLTPMSSRVTAPDVTVAIDASTLDVTEANDALVVSVDLLVTNVGSVELHDVWLQWPLPDGVATANLTPVDGASAWVALDDWWYGENVDLAPNATQRVRVTLETQP